MINNEIKLSRNRKRRIERRLKLDDNRKLLFRKLKQKRKRKVKTLIKLKIWKFYWLKLNVLKNLIIYNLL